MPIWCSPYLTSSGWDLDIRPTRNNEGMEDDNLRAALQEPKTVQVGIAWLGTA